MSSNAAKAIDQFSPRAHAYVESIDHSHGPDLELVTRVLAGMRYERALDVATGGGHCALTIAPYCDKVIAADVTPAMVEAARAFFAEQEAANIEVVEADAHALPFEDHHFDLVTCRIAPHHFEDPAAFVAEVARVLKPGGKFLLIDNIAPEDDRLDAFINWLEAARDPSHVRNLKVSQWRENVEAAGLEIRECLRLERRHIFDRWCRRAGMDDAAIAELTADVLRTEKAALEAYDVQTDLKGTRIESFRDLKVFLLARKPS